MRRSWIVIAAGTALLAAAPLVAAPATAAPARARHRTVQSVVRPVTSSGHAAAGYRVVRVTRNAPVYCSGSGTPSRVAVDNDIVYCSPDAANADACWRAAQRHHVLCLTGAAKHVLLKYRVSGPIGRVKAPEHPTPLTVRLADGVVCDLRDGGAGPYLREHHNWGVFYYCTQGQAVWAPLNAGDYGLHRHHDREWTVELAAANGKHDVHPVRVKHAYYVGTQHSVAGGRGGASARCALRPGPPGRRQPPC